ncbi:hypothetical protein DBR17_14520 [Sphingomonas sp. HMWF008]|nr:hypothetical protein DBR17_14520 [Sphingomonas sp. HMWF008]
MTTLYHVDPYLKEKEGIISAAFEEDDGSFCVAFEDGLFYPQGGGQKGDRGVIELGGKQYVVSNTVKDPMSSDGRALCILEKPADIKQGDTVVMRLNWEHRYAQMRLHSIVHLHHCMMEDIVGHSLPNPATSDINDDGTAYNRYETEEITQELAEQASAKMATKVAEGASIETRADDLKAGFRYWESLGHVIPCGGTHLRDISEIGRFETQFGRKKGKPKVGFTLVG